MKRRAVLGHTAATEFVQGVEMFSVQKSDSVNAGNWHLNDHPGTGVVASSVYRRLDVGSGALRATSGEIGSASSLRPQERATEVVRPQWGLYSVPLEQPRIPLQGLSPQQEPRLAEVLPPLQALGQAVPLQEMAQLVIGGAMPLPIPQQDFMQQLWPFINQIPAPFQPVQPPWRPWHSEAG